MSKGRPEPKQSILIVEDEEPVRRHLAATLRNHFPGTNVRTARNFKEALTKFDDRPCDLLLLDMNLREGPDGIQLLLALRERPYPFRAIGITAFASSYAFKAGKIGLDALIEKPMGDDSVDLIRTQLIEARQLQKREQKLQAFCVMPFAPEFTDRYLFGIKVAAERSGYRCSRIDESVFTQDILTEIQQNITGADVIIADVTGSNPNVYYEIGYAHALAKPVVLVAASTEELIFDIRNMRHIVYEGFIHKLQETLASTLEELRRAR